MNYVYPKAKEKILAYENKHFVKRVIQWGFDNDLLAFQVSSTYVLNDLTQLFMSSRVLYYWDKITKAWKNKRQYLQKSSNGLTKCYEKFNEVKETLTKTNQLAQLEKNRVAATKTLTGYMLAQLCDDHIHEESQ